MLNGGYTSHHVHRLNVLSGDGAHVGSKIDEIGPEVAVSRGILQIRIIENGFPVYRKPRSKGRCGIISRQRTGCPQINHFWGAEGRVARHSAGQEFEKIGNAGGLDMADGVLPYLGCRCESVILLCRNDNLAQGKHIRLQAVGAALDQ